MTDELISMTVGLMVEAGFKPITNDLEVGGVKFGFSLMFVGDGKSLDLILVSTADDDVARLPQKVSALARALDFVGSRRSLTVVALGWAPVDDAAHSLSRLARLLIVPSGSSLADLRNSLLVLMPLLATSVGSSDYDTTAELSALVGAAVGELRESGLLDSELTDGGAVRDVLRAWLASPFDEKDN